MGEDKKISLTKRRKLLIQFFYRYLLMKNTPEYIRQDLLDEIQEPIDEETFKIAEEITRNLAHLIAEVKPLLVENWKWERVPALVQSILIVGTFEITATDTPKAVTVNEMTTIAKEWGLNQEYKFINAILDKIDKI